MSESDISKLREEIAREYEAAYNGLHGFAAVAKVPHLHRTECTERISEAHQHLSHLVGPDEAMTILAEVLNTSQAGPYTSETMLHYQPETDRWIGESQSFTIWMEDSTFQQYVNAYLEGCKIVNPTSEQRAAAARYCRRLRYWHGCERNYDRRVHISYKTPASDKRRESGRNDVHS